MMVFAMPRLKYKVMDAASKAHLHARMLIQVLNRMRMQALHPPLQEGSTFPCTYYTLMG